MNQQEELIHYGSNSIAYSIVKSKGVKTSEIIFDADKVIVRAVKPQEIKLNCKLL
jgi:hypothetical protein